MSNPFKIGDTFIIRALHRYHNIYRDTTPKKVYSIASVGVTTLRDDPEAVTFMDDKGDVVVAPFYHLVKKPADE